MDAKCLIGDVGRSESPSTADLRLRTGQGFGRPTDKFLGICTSMVQREASPDCDSIFQRWVQCANFRPNTHSIFDRYDIVNERDLSEAAEK